MGNVIKLKPTSINNGSSAQPLQSAANPTIVAIQKDIKRFNRVLREARKTGASVDVDELKVMRKTLRKLIPTAAITFATFKNDRAAVALNILMNQQREVINDLRSLDMGPRQIEHIMQKILQPMLQSILQNYMTVNHDLKLKVKKVKDKQQRAVILKDMDKFLEQQGQLFNILQEGIQERLTEYLIGKSK